MTISKKITILSSIPRSTLDRVFWLSPDAQAITDSHQKILFVNKEFESTLGYPLEELVGMQISKILPKRPALKIKNLENKQQYEITTEDSIGVPITLAITSVSILADKPDGKTEIINYLFSIKDITEERQQQTELREFAFTDSLTGVYNRRYFLKQFEQHIAHHNRTKLASALFLLDVDNFSEINNTLGHLVGDKLLVEFVHRLKSVFRRDVDIVGRLGGDEFVAILSNDNPKINILDMCKTIAEKLMHEFSSPYELEGIEKIKITASVGIAIFESASVVNGLNLIKLADEQMYKAKDEGKNSYNIIYNSMEIEKG